MKKLSIKEQIEVILKRKLATGEALHSQDVIDVLGVFNKPADLTGIIKSISMDSGSHEIHSIEHYEPRMIGGIPTISYDVEVKVRNPTPEQINFANMVMSNRHVGPALVDINLSNAALKV